MLDNEDEITRLLKLSAQLAQKIGETLPHIKQSLEKTNFKQTSRALLSFVVRSGYLNSAILNACGTGNIYSAATLFRPMIEHNFRHLYIFVRALNENTDSVGEKYYKQLKANEDMEAFDKVNNYNKVVYPEKDKWNTKGEHNNAIRIDAKEFRIEQIFYYLVSNNNKQIKDIEQYKKGYLLERIVQYTNLSSSVHGGPFGEATLLEAQRKSPHETLGKFAMESSGLHKSLVETTYLFAYLMDASNQEYYENIKTVV